MPNQTEKVFLDRDKVLREIYSDLEDTQWVDRVEVVEPHYEPSGVRGVSFTSEVKRESLEEGLVLETVKDSGRDQMLRKILDDGLNRHEEIWVKVTARRGVPASYKFVFISPTRHPDEGR